jgi:hypothetical protein
MGLEHGWNDGDRERPEVSIEEFVPLSVFNPKFQGKWPEIEPVPSQEKVGD